MKTDTVDLTDKKWQPLSDKIADLVEFANENKYPPVVFYAFAKKLELILADHIGLVSADAQIESHDELEAPLSMKELVCEVDYVKMKPLLDHLNQINTISKTHDLKSKEVIMVIFDYWSQLQKRFGLSKVVESNKTEYDAQQVVKNEKT